MRIYCLELKRILKTRTTIVLLAAALLLSAWMAYLPITFEEFDYVNAEGEEIKLKGRKALEYGKKLEKEYTGTVTTDKIEKALRTYQETIKKYGDIYSDDFPQYVSVEQMLPTYSLTKRIGENYADSKSGMAAELTSLDPEEMQSFYKQCKIHLKDLMNMEQSKHPNAKKQAMKIFENVDMPYSYYSGYGSNSIDYLTLYLYVLVFITALIAAPVFSSEYQTGADDILRCTRHGRTRLAVVKTLSVLTICIVSFGICLTVHTVIANTLFGWECRKTSMQILYSVVSLWNLNLGQMQNLMIAAGFLTMIATICFVLLLSANSKTTVSALAMTFLALLLPVILYQMAGDINIANWLRILIPANGTGLGNSFTYALTDFGFLHLGNFSIWIPYAMLIAAALEIPLLAGFTIYMYNRKKA